MPERVPLSFGFTDPDAAVLFSIFRRARGRCEGCQRPIFVAVPTAIDGCWFDADLGWRDSAGEPQPRSSCREAHDADGEPLTEVVASLSVVGDPPRALCHVCRGLWPPHGS